MKLKKIRIDKLLVEKGLVSTRARAQAMILAGHVLVNDEPIQKAGESVFEDVQIRLREPELKYVSRGALKLKAALAQFNVIPEGLIAIDVGASTGGFSEVLLDAGVEKIYAIDVGTNQLAWKIRSHPKVVSKENYNARYLLAEDFKEKIDLVVMDVSFISIKLIIPALMAITRPGSQWVVLFKPQFEVGREHIQEGGIVKDQKQAKKNIEEVIAWAQDRGLSAQGVMDSPILGMDGNKEYLIYWKKM